MINSTELIIIYINKMIEKVEQINKNNLFSPQGNPPLEEDNNPKQENERNPSFNFFDSNCFEYKNNNSNELLDTNGTNLLNLEFNKNEKEFQEDFLKNNIINEGINTISFCLNLNEDEILNSNNSANFQNQDSALKFSNERKRLNYQISKIYKTKKKNRQKTKKSKNYYKANFIKFLMDYGNILIKNSNLSIKSKRGNCAFLLKRLNI